MLGIVLSVLSCVGMARDSDDYTRAALAAERNTGNVMYEAELGKAQLRRAFEIVGASLGALLALNGATLIGLGSVAARGARQRLR